MDEKIRLRNMTAIYLQREDKLLMLFRQGSKVAGNTWIGSAGGHFEACEMNDPRTCVLRELNEEMTVSEDMLSNLHLRYITFRRAKGEIRVNYYFFADLKNDHEMNFTSNEGILKWFEFDELLQLEMPFSAKFMMKHYLSIGRYNDKIYTGVADGEKVVFTELPEF